MSASAAGSDQVAPRRRSSPKPGSVLRSILAQTSAYRGDGVLASTEVIPVAAPSPRPESQRTERGSRDADFAYHQPHPYDIHGDKRDHVAERGTIHTEGRDEQQR